MDQKSGNLTGLYQAAEESLGVLPETPKWVEREPNSYGDFGGTFAMTTRKPITHDRQSRKGDVSDNNPTVSYNEDFTLTNMIDPFQSFLFADAREKPSTMPLNGTERTITAVSDNGGAGPYTFAAAAGLSSFLVGHIVLSSNFGDSNNNGINIVAAAASGLLTVESPLEPEAAPPADARIDAVGFMFAAGDLSMTVDADSVTLTSATVDLRTLSLVEGEWIAVGGDTAITRFADSGNNAPFYGRVAEIDEAAGAFVRLDKTTGTQATDAGAAKEIQIFFGTVIKNEDDCELIKLRSYTFERQYGCGADQEAEYVGGSVANQLTLNIPTPGADAKINIDLAYISTTSYERTAAEGVLAGTRVAAANEPVYKPGINVYRNRMAVIDPVTLNPTPLVAYNQQVSLVINNNLGGNKAIEAFGNSGINIGEFAVSGTATSYFNGVEVTRSVRQGAELTWDTILTKANAAFVLDIASYGLGNAKANVAPNEPITLPLEGTAGKGSFGYTILTSFFRYVPTVLVANQTA